MTKYESLSLSDEDGTENCADHSSSLLHSNFSNTPFTHHSTQKPFFPSRSTERLAILLLIVNVFLAVANIWTTHEIRSLFDDTQTMNVMSLPRADQYIGLSDLSREFCRCISFRSYL